MADDNEPRRYKLSSEFDDDDRATKSRFGGDGYRPERPEYIEWRKRTLEKEHDDLVLRERLLREQAGMLRTQAAGAAMDALEAVTVGQHSEQLLAAGEAWRNGTEPPAPPGRSGTADKLNEKADGLEPR
jgi:hypothetical protein